jgi:ubiquinone biosynthesis protein COQ4
MKRIKDAVLLTRAAYSFIDLVRHPEHLDRVFEIADALSESHTEVLEAMRDHFGRDAGGAKALVEKPRLRVDVRELSKLPAGTLGRVFADHLRENGLDPASIPSLSADTDIAFVRAHLYETHDVWHAATGFGADPAGELGLQAFYAAQTPGNLPLLLMAVGLLNAGLFSRADRDRRLEAISQGWAMGRRARPLFGIRWDELWSRPVSEVRAYLGIEAYAETVPARAA